MRIPAPTPSPNLKRITGYGAREDERRIPLKSVIMSPSRIIGI
jgi:hypothetical protein